MSANAGNALFTVSEMEIISQYPEDVQEELLDLDYRGRQHYSRATYALGCHGPLCRLAETHRGRKRTESRALEAGREYKPNLDARETANELLLAPIIAWHLHLREGKRLARTAAQK